MYSLLASATNHPDRVNRLWGLFNHRTLNALVGHGVDVEAVVPRPHAPPIGPYSEYRAIPAEDGTFSYPVSHPRFLYYLPKSLFYHRTGDSMAETVSASVGDESYDVLHGCHVYPDGYALSGLATDRDVPLTVYAHGTIIDEFETFNRGTRERIRTTLERADRVFCSGRDVRSAVEEIDPESETAVVPIGATPSNFPTERREEIRRELKIPEGATVVLFCGHLLERKGVQDLLDVLPDLREESLYVVFVGHDGDLRDDVRTALGREDTPPGTLFWQLHPVAVRRWFVAADLLVLPSYREGRPTVVYEAMASRTPVLATTVGGIPEQVVPEETGWLFEPGDVSALRSRLRSLSDGKLQRMGAAAKRRLLAQGWTWADHAERIADVHESLLESDAETSTAEPEPTNASVDED